MRGRHVRLRMSVESPFDPPFDPAVPVPGRGSVGRDGPTRPTPVLLINGIGATLDLFDPLRAVLTDRTTIAFDAPGVGGSATPRTPLSMRGYAGVVADAVRRLGIEQVDLVGISWGGALVQEFAYRHPRLVRRIVLAATTPGIGGWPGRPSALSVLATPARYYLPGYLKRVAPTLYGREILDHPDLLRQHARLRATRPPTPIGYTWQLAAIARWSSLPYLHRLRQPALVLAGDDDPIIPVANGRLLARRIPDARLHVVPGGGHLFLFLRASTMAPLIVDFLDALPRTPRR